MELTIIFGVLLLVSILFVIYLSYGVSWREKGIKALQEELVKVHLQLSEEQEKKSLPPTQFGIITKYNEDDLNILRKNTEATMAVIKVLTYQTILRSDSMRNPENADNPNALQRKIGETNAFHEMLLFFYKLTIKEEEKE